MSFFFAIIEPRTQRVESSARAARKDAISDGEKLLYRQAVSKIGNDWRKILGFFVKHQELLPEEVKQRYATAFKNIDNKDAVKPIRNRLSNICRKVRNEPEIREREERNAKSMNNMTAENIIVRMKNVQALEKDDPLRSSPRSDSEVDQLDRPGTSYNTLSSNDEIFGQSSESADELESADSLDDAEMTANKANKADQAMKKNKSNKKGKKTAKRLKKGQNLNQESRRTYVRWFEGGKTPYEISKTKRTVARDGHQFQLR